MDGTRKCHPEQGNPITKDHTWYSLTNKWMLAQKLKINKLQFTQHRKLSITCNLGFIIEGNEATVCIFVFGFACTLVPLLYPEPLIFLFKRIIVSHSLLEVYTVPFV